MVRGDGMKDHGQQLPTGVLDYVVVSAIAAGLVAMLLGNATMIWHRNYRPIKTKNIPLTLASSVGGLVWIIATIVVNAHFPRPLRSGLDICVLWTFWLQLCFGFSLWLNCLTVHLFTLFRIFVWKSINSSLEYFLLFALLLPAITLSVASTVWRKKIMKFEKSNGGNCRFSARDVISYALLALMCINFLVFIAFAFRLRNVMAPFNEYRLIRRGGILSLFLVLLSLVTIQTYAYDEPVGRCFLSAAVASAVFYYFWARNGVVIYNVLFNHDAYLVKFLANLRRHPSEHERATSFGSLRNMQNQLQEVTEEVKQCLNTMTQLKEEVNVLEMECNKLEQQQANVKH